MKHLLTLTLRCDKNFLAKGLAMLFLPNGDPAQTDRIDVWVPTGIVVDEDRVRASVASALDTLLLSTNVPIVNRHRWNQSDAAENRFILMEGLFGLGSSIFRKVFGGHKVGEADRPHPLIALGAKHDQRDS